MIPIDSATLHKTVTAGIFTRRDGSAEIYPATACAVIGVVDIVINFPAAHQEGAVKNIDADAGAGADIVSNDRAVFNSDGGAGNGYTAAEPIAVKDDVGEHKRSVC